MIGSRDFVSRGHLEFAPNFVIKGEKLEVLSDFELIKRTNDGYPDAFCILVRRYQRPLHSLSMRYVHDSFLAEDIVQESFLKAFEKLSGFQFRSAFKSWMYRIVINTAKNSLRSKKPMVDIDKVQIKEDPQSEVNLIERELFERASEIIKGLPDKQRQALSLRVFEDLSFKEVAKEMDCPYDTAKANYRHGLIKIQEKMVSVI